MQSKAKHFELLWNINKMKHGAKNAKQSGAFWAINKAND